MSNFPHILIVDPEENSRYELSMLFQEKGRWHVAEVSSIIEAKRILSEQSFSVVVVEINLPDGNGFEFLNFISQEYPNTGVVIMSSSGSIEPVASLLHLGGDYIAKPFNSTAVLLTVRRVFETVRLKKQLVHLQSAVEDRYRFENIIGRSKAMQSVFELIRRISTSDVNIVISGASGTGKEIVGRAIHYRSSRKNKPFIPVECAAIPDTLLEAELFGYQKGAFTDAKTNKAGLMLEAGGGTLFLDDVSEFPLPLQAKLLRSIQEREIRPLGSTKTIPIDVRIIATTNVDLNKMVAEHLFRKDLYYRLNVMEIHLPQLSERKEDIPPLVDHFLKLISQRIGKNVIGVDGPALKLMLDYDWPGNVRELENVMERAIALTRGTTIMVEDLPEAVSDRGRNEKYLDLSESPVTLKEIETQYIKTLLKKFNGNKAKVAKTLGVDRKTLYNKLGELKSRGIFLQDESS